MLPAEAFWAALAACGCADQARYLAASALRLDPKHATALAATIHAALDTPTVAALAHDAAVEATAALPATALVCRSSSALEDGRDAAFPGIFLSVLHIREVETLAAAIAACWRSAFSATAVAYLLRVGRPPLDLSLACLIQPLVPAEWYGLYVSVDPVSGVGGARAELSSLSPDALVNGVAGQIVAEQVDGAWRDAGPLAGALERVADAAGILRTHLGAEIDLEFALPAADAAPVLLQCRPLTRVGGAQAGDVSGDALRGRPCAGGLAQGIAGAPGGIAVVERLDTGDYGLVFDHAGIVMTGDASPLSHVAILCRELGVPFVCGVTDGRALLGRVIQVDGAAGTVALELGASPRAPPAETQLWTTDLEQHLRRRAGLPPLRADHVLPAASVSPGRP